MTVHTRVKRIEQIMTREPVSVAGGTTLRELARLFQVNEISGAPVVDTMGRVIGVVSRTDLVRRCTEGLLEAPPGALFEMLSEEAGEGMGFEPETEITVDEFMTPEPLTCRPEASAEAVARSMSEARVHRAIVVNDAGEPVGIVTSLDLLGALSAQP